MFTPFRGSTPSNFGDLQEELNRLLSRWWHGGISTPPFDGQDWAPPWDVYERPDEYVAEIELCGMDPADVDVSFVGQTLTITGNRPTGAEAESRRSYLRRERRSGGFSRSVQLADPVDADQLTATCSHGLLTVVMPKKTDPSRRTVKVEVRTS